jgi:serine phosphatase RsbU (regulator of sigma subunit)
MLFQSSNEDNCNLEELLSRQESYNKKKNLIEEMLSKQQKISAELYNALDKSIIKYGPPPLNPVITCRSYLSFVSDEENEKLKTLLPHSKSKEVSCRIVSQCLQF